MRVNGIIAEYNPFHNGHKYQMEESRRITGADYTIVVISGNFVQRGAPALLDKFSRAEMALRCGADLVMEIPSIYAASSAEYFATGGVSLLNQLNVVTHLCFGSESGDIGILRQIASILREEPEEFSRLMKANLRQGSLSHRPLKCPDAVLSLSGIQQQGFFHAQQYSGHRIHKVHPTAEILYGTRDGPKAGGRLSRPCTSHGMLFRARNPPVSS